METMIAVRIRRLTKTQGITGNLGGGWHQSNRNNTDPRSETVQAVRWSEKIYVSERMHEKGAIRPVDYQSHSVGFDISRIITERSSDTTVRLWIKSAKQRRMP